MSTDNGFFTYSDERSEIIAGMKIPQDWWSRPYEYAWALKYAKPGDAVADMGCGWMYRPFKDALADVCGYVVAMDTDNRLLEQTKKDNMAFVVADFTKHTGYEDGFFDTIFCISVLEDLGYFGMRDALKEFARLLKPGGRIIITFDVQYDLDKPLGKYPGVVYPELMASLDGNKLVTDGSFEYNKTNAVHHDGFNLCCAHMVVKHANNTMA